MKNSMKRRLHNIFLLFLLIALVAININTAMNGHFHLFDNGRVLFHAHPVDKSHSSSATQSTNHSSMDLLYLGCLTVLLSQVILVLIFFLVFQPGLLFSAIRTIKFNCVFNRICFDLRAPPQLFAL